MSEGVLLIIFSRSCLLMSDPSRLSPDQLLNSSENWVSHWGLSEIKIQHLNINQKLTLGYALSKCLAAVDEWEYK